MKKKLMMFSVLWLVGTVIVRGQQVEKNAEMGELIRIASTFHEMPYLSFQTQTIIEDSGSFQPLPLAGGPVSASGNDTINGQYKLSEGRYWALMDSIEYVQGYNYNLAVYHDEKIIAVAKPSTQVPVFSLDLMDSSFQQAHVAGLSITTVDSTTRYLRIEFTNEAPYSGYEMYYNKNTHQISNITYYLKNGYDRGDGTMGTAKVRMEIFNYSTTPFSPNYFSEEKFITRDAQGFKSRPAYTNYQIIPATDL